MRFRRKPALSAVYGFIVVYTLIIAGLGAISAVMDGNAGVESARQRAGQLESTRSHEHLTLTLSPGSVRVVNDGLVTTTIADLHVVSPGTSTDTRLSTRLAVGSSISISVSSSAGQVAAVTSLGNVFWTGMGAQTANYTITFDANGIPPSFSGAPVLTVDGKSYQYYQLPRTFDWSPFSGHSYSYIIAFPASQGTRVGWADTRGLQTTRSGQFAASQSGIIVADYSQQYQLAISGGSNVAVSPPSPTADGYYNQGTTVRVSTDYAWNSVAQQSRQSLISYQLDSSSPTLVARSGNGTFSALVTMNSPHTVKFNPVTQYFLRLTADVPSSGTAPYLSLGYSYYQPFTISQALTNPGFETGTISGWSTNSGTCGTGVLFGPDSDPNNYGYVHSGYFSAYLFATNGPGCAYQLFSLPSNAVITSVSGSAWVTLAGLPSGPPVINVEIKAGNNLNSPTCDVSSTQYDPLYNWYKYSVSSTSCSGTQLQFDIGFPATAANYIYFDDASFSYSYNLVTSGAVQSVSSTYSVSESSVAYSYALSYSFPAGVLGRQLQFTLPSDESIASLVSQTCGSVSSSMYSVSGKTVTIPDSTIAACGGNWIVGSTATGSYAVFQTGSQTRDGWYDAGSTAGISASATTPFVFKSWGGAPTIFSPSSATTSLTMDSYYAVGSRFDVTA